ncbi:helix-turn-helix domain-containing protein [Bosea sp. 2RAB26]|uniref:helix-turn-helix domain-containing protein n=1 Tax=Bosea sp. 2RAB26 TaxID=3237476 RepID=UPI003F907559
MPAIPLPFVVALLLTILLIRVFLQDRTLLKPVTLFIGTCILLVVTVGLRWTIDAPWVRFLQPVMAALLPPIAWLCFARLRQPPALRSWPHVLAPVAILILSCLWQRWQAPIDLILALLFFGYGAALVRHGHAGPDQFESVRLSDAQGARRAVSVIGLLLICSGIIDLLIAADFGSHQGSHAAVIVAVGNLLLLPVIAYAIAVIGRSVPDDEPLDRSGRARTVEPEHQPNEAASASPTEEDVGIMAMVETAMRQKTIYRDPDLTLNRLARRLGLPSRSVSNAINRTLGRNVPQLVNEYRVREAMRLLGETDLPVTGVMFECGFQTKSNFNREFARVTGTTPSEYRRAGGAPAGETSGSTA